MSARSLILLSALTAASALHAPLAAQAEHLPLCAAEGYGGSYNVDFLKNKKGATEGRLVVDVDFPSTGTCAATTYAFTVESYYADRALGWNTTETRPVGGGTSPEEDGKVHITLTEAGKTSLGFTGTTSPSYAEPSQGGTVCIRWSLRITNAGMDVTQGPLEWCDGGSPAGSFSH